MIDESTAKPCRECQSGIPQAALMCPVCKSYQDWRRFFPTSSTVLAILTALISVLTVSVPIIYHALHKAKSHAYFTSPSIDGTTLRIVAVNTGDAPATFISARVDGDYLADATKVRLRNDTEAMIPPGSKLMALDIIPLLNEEQAYNGSLDMIARELEQGDRPKESILLGIAESDGNILVQRVPISTDDLFKILRSDADRCSAIESANFQNGCIGNGLPPKDLLPKNKAQKNDGF